MNVNFKEFIDDVLSYKNACMELMEAGAALEVAKEAVDHNKSILDKKALKTEKEKALSQLKKDVRKKNGYKYFEMIEDMTLSIKGVWNDGDFSFIKAVNESPDRDRIYGLIVDFDKLNQNDNEKRMIQRINEISVLMDFKENERDQENLTTLLSNFGKEEWFLLEPELETERE